MYISIDGIRPNVRMACVRAAEPANPLPWAPLASKKQQETLWQSDELLREFVWRRGLRPGQCGSPKRCVAVIRLSGTNFRRLR
jgi:hypothetical protein